MRTGSLRSRSRSNTRRPSLPSAYAREAPATPAPTTITSHCVARGVRRRATGSVESRREHFERVSRKKPPTVHARRSAVEGARLRSRPKNRAVARACDVTAAATRARAAASIVAAADAFEGGGRSRYGSESGTSRRAREMRGAPRTRRRRTRSLRHLGPSSRVRLTRDSASRRPGGRRDALERRPASRGAGLDARRCEARVRVFRCGGRERVGLQASVAETRARRMAQ